VPSKKSRGLPTSRRLTPGPRSYAACTRPTKNGFSNDLPHRACARS
jgi:hypothetical protein